MASPELIGNKGYERLTEVFGPLWLIPLLRSHELDAAGETSIEAAMRAGPSTFRPFVSIEYMAKFMVEHELDSSPVTTSDGRLVGLLMRQDVERVARDLSQKKGLEEPGS